uniref:Crooked neck-like protein 1 n=1 Tax=Elaeis guineensis var. tenera TaxID=51953 RepID=A0A6I9QDH2_ELAGV|nr:crooked neck-like protein 1 [Elaeis guineensis]
MHYDQATLHFSYAKFEASVSIEDEEVGCGAPNISLLCGSMYAELERSLSEIERTRAIFELAVAQPTLDMLELLCKACIDYEYETLGREYERTRSLSEIKRARAIFELTVAQPTLDMPELLCKTCIDYEYETSGGEYERTRQVYERLLDRTKYLKVWISYVKFEASVGIEDEEVNCGASNTSLLCGSMYVELKRLLSEIERARAIFELAVAQPILDMPELLCKACIDYEYETSGGEYERTKQVYERLLDRTKHLKVWISYTKFEASIGMKDEEVGCGASNTSLLCGSMSGCARPYEYEISGDEYERTRLVYERLLD